MNKSPEKLKYKNLKAQKRNEIFAQNLKIQRENNGMTQIELAKKLHLTSSSISSWERKETFPNREHLNKLSSALGVSIPYLLGKTNRTSDDIMTDPATGQSKIVKVLGLRPDFQSEIIDIISTLEAEQKSYLYDLLLTIKHFETNEWKSLILMANLLSQCHIPILKSYHPLTNFHLFTSFFSKTLNSLNLLKNDLTTKNFKKGTIEYKKINRLLFKIDDFMDSLNSDFTKIPNIFEDINTLKKAIPLTDDKITEIISDLKQVQFIPCANGEKNNEFFQREYIELVSKAYTEDLLNMVNCFYDS